ncbi:MAG: 23S rRNA (guanosine(2251)-2'-O)-methyltransferase RlmB [Leptospiraceae bacterium]|nr:23S rRNA (guanosine(2251)-2'-O)-methyltransferase RlmB [Leptospiraceae bacterium]MCP5497485.1 23S rRNA (guanosine(2251)-2'-O)-methyltransferase RlmB [Leptospiraceae bacterium]
MEKNLKNIVYGRRNVSEFIKKKLSSNIPVNQWSIKEILVKTDPSKEIIDEFLSLLPSNLSIKYVSRKELDRLFPREINHQGIAIILKEMAGGSEYLSLGDLKKFIEAPEKSFILLLDRIQDAGNLGSMLRTAECFGVKHVVIPDRDQVKITEAVVRTSSGATHHLNIYKVANLHQTIDFMKKNGYWIVASSDTGEDNWNNLPDTKNIGLIIGNEHDGIKNILLENSDFILRISISGKISSLNVGVACGIFLDRLINRRF